MKNKIKLNEKDFLIGLKKSILKGENVLSKIDKRITQYDIDNYKVDEKKLYSEIKEFFKENKYENYKIKKFELRVGMFPDQYKLIPEEPYLDEVLSGDKVADKFFEDLSKKYKIRRISWASWCYGK